MLGIEYFVIEGLTIHQEFITSDDQTIELKVCMSAAMVA